MTLTDEVFGLSREERQGGGGISSGAAVIIDRLPLADCHNPILKSLPNQIYLTHKSLPQDRYLSSSNRIKR